MHYWLARFWLALGQAFVRGSMLLNRWGGYAIERGASHTLRLEP